MNLFGAIILRTLFKEQYAGIEEAKVPLATVKVVAENNDNANGNENTTEMVGKVHFKNNEY